MPLVIKRTKTVSEKVSMLRSLRESESANIKRRREHYETIKKYDEKLKYFDERYAMITKVFMNEIVKRKISIDDPELDDKIDEILSFICEGRYYQSRFQNDNIIDVKNAVLRRVNAEKQKIQEER